MSAEEREVAGLRCRDVLAVLSEFLDGSLDEGRRAAVIAHVESCTWCEQFGGRFGELVADLKTSLRACTPIEADVADRLRRTIVSRGGPDLT